MAFWSDKTFEPKRENRWLLYIAGFEPWMISTFKKPSYQINVSKYQILNDVFKKPNVVVWNDVEVTITDGSLEKGSGQSKFSAFGSELNDALIKNNKSPTAGGINTTQTLMRKLAGLGYATPLGLPEVATSITKDQMVKTFGNIIRFQQLNAAGNPIDTWSLHNPILKSVNFGDARYESDNLNKITMSFEYDFATFS